MRLFLVRHAHAGWALPGARDFDRSLDDLGHAEAARLASAVAVNGYAPEQIICSTARRCSETLGVVTGAGSFSGTVVYTDTLYTGGCETYLGLIANAQAEGRRSLMLVGHNPMLEETANALFSRDRATADSVLGRGFPTAGLLVVDLAGDGEASLVGLIGPQDG